MWKCKKCGEEVTILAEFKTKYIVSLNKNKEIDDYEEYKSSNYEDAEIIDVYCENCGKEGSLEEIAEWIN